MMWGVRGWPVSLWKTRPVHRLAGVRNRDARYSSRRATRAFRSGSVGRVRLRTTQATFSWRDDEQTWKEKEDRPNLWNCIERSSAG